LDPGEQVGDQRVEQVWEQMNKAYLKFRIHCRVAPVARQPIEHRSG